MAVNSVEKKAQQLNGYLRSHGKKLGKSWRLRVRSLLAQTFEALNAKPLNGALCLELAGKIEREIAAIEGGDPVLEEEPAANLDEASEALPKSQKITSWSSAEREYEKAARIAVGNSDANEPRIASANSSDNDSDRGDQSTEVVLEDDSGAGEPRIAYANSSDNDSDRGEQATEVALNADSGAGDASPDKKIEKTSDEIGLFDLIHIQIRCFFTLNACIRPPYIGKFVQYADKYGEVVQARVDRFIKVLSKNEDEFAEKLEVEVGYDDDLLPDMPERGLVLYPRKKKKR